jgi:2'-5' RNA ligase
MITFVGIPCPSLLPRLQPLWDDPQFQASMRVSRLGLHLTLLPPLSVLQPEPLVTLIRQVASEVAAPIQLRFTEPFFITPSVLCLRVDSGELVQLQTKLFQAALKAGLRYPERTPNPHLTIGRRTAKPPIDQTALIHLAQLRLSLPLGALATDIRLYGRQHTEQPYRAVQDVPLGL